MERVTDIAKWFLSHESMTPKKIQKLCYYAQAWSLALYDQPMFEDRIEAWVHGPVIPSLYPVYKDYKWKAVPKDNITTLDNFDENTTNILEAVWKTYSPLSGDQLESLTHSEEPWIEARGDLKPWEPGTNEISRNSMKEFYGKKYEEAQGE